MSAERLSLDSNIFFYTIDADAGRLQHDRELDGVRCRNPFLAGDPFAG
jgi:predicted nucleic acid-binding protein